MAANSISITEDAEMAECEGDKVVTMMDVLQEQQDFEDDANAVLGASDDKNCTYPQGYIKRQALYACLTCCPEAKVDPLKRAGLCLACSLLCHENHELVELYTKRNFRCDCGNPKFSHPCQFTADKTDLNNENIYNQNFSGLYCVCERPYPDPEATFEDDMIQCIVCEDWLHASHLDAVVPGNDQYTEMICKACMEKNEFLNDYTIYAINSESADVDVVNGEKSVNASLCNGDDEKYVNGDENKDVTSIQTSIVINGTYEDAKEETINTEINSSKINMTIDESSSVKVTDEVNISEAEQSKSDENIDEQVKLDKSSVVESTKTNSEIDSTKTDVNGDEMNINESDKVKSTEPTEKENSEIDSTKMDSGSESQKEGNESKSDSVENGQNSEGNNIEPHTNETSVTEPDQENKIEEVTMDNEPDVKETKESKVGENENETKDNEPDIEGTEKSKVTENEDETKDNEPDVEKSEASEIGENEDITKDNEPIVKETEESKVGENENVTMDNEPDVEETEESKVSENKDETKDNEPNVKKTEKSDSAGENTEKAGETETFGECKNVDGNKKPDDLEQLTEETKMVDTTTDPVVDAIDALLNPDPQEKAVNEKSSPEVPDSTEATITNDMEIDTKQKSPVETRSKLADEEMNGSTKESESLTSENDRNVDLDNDPNETETNKIQPTDNPTKENEALIENGILSENDSTNNDNTTSCNTENSNEHKRKLSTDFTDNKSPKKAKLNEKCVRPTGVKKSHKGATFWHSNFRSKLCTCGECISMYKDLNVLFLTDLEDTVSYYESIGKSNVDNGVSQYEKGMQALSSLDRIQQINALTEYNNMRDKLLDFLKSFKDRKEIVKEEDIKAFFAGMKPRREPDGVYFF